MDLLVPLAGLALIDSTSLGTLVLPLWMLAQPHLRPSRYVLYLGAVAVLYALVGVALVLSAGGLRMVLAELGEGPALDWLQLTAGAGLLVLAVRRRRVGARTNRVQQWQQRAVGPDARVRSTVALALIAVGLEITTMLPYLGAMVLLAGAELPAVQWLAVLAGYVFVMIAPALALLVLRRPADRWLRPVIVRARVLLRSGRRLPAGALVGLFGGVVAADAGAGLLGV